MSITFDEATLAGLPATWTEVHASGYETHATYLPTTCRRNGCGSTACGPTAATSALREIKRAAQLGVPVVRSTDALLAMRGTEP